MSLSVDVTSNLDQTARAYAGSEQRAEAKIRAINVRASRELLKVARSVVHVKTGRLRDGLIVEGPFNVASGELVATISAPSVSYADIEAARGGLHDFATRTIAEGASVIDQAAADMEAAIIAVMEGSL